MAVPVVCSFVLVLGHSESELYSVYLFGFLTFKGRFRNFLKSFLKYMDLLVNQTSRFIGLGFPEQQFRYFALFVLVLGHSESELHSVYFIRFLSL